MLCSKDDPGRIYFGLKEGSTVMLLKLKEVSIPVDNDDATTVG